LEPVVLIARNPFVLASTGALPSGNKHPNRMLNLQGPLVTFIPSL
jgi:hypothetical protein